MAAESAGTPPATDSTAVFPPVVAGPAFDDATSVFPAAVDPAALSSRPLTAYDLWGEDPPDPAASGSFSPPAVASETPASGPSTYAATGVSFSGGPTSDPSPPTAPAGNPTPTASGDPTPSDPTSSGGTPSAPTPAGPDAPTAIGAIPAVGSPAADQGEPRSDSPLTQDTDLDIPRPVRRTPPNLLATNPRKSEPAWMSLATPPDPQQEEKILAELKDATRPILNLKELIRREPPPQSAPTPLASRPAPPAPRPMAGPVIDPPDDDIAPWDRRPLLIALAAGVVLVLVGILSGVASASFFGGTSRAVDWRGPGGPAQPTAPAGGPAAPAQTVTLSGVGDVIMGTLPGDLPPRGGDGFFDPVKDALAADLVMGNLEVPLTRDTGRVKCPLVTPSPRPGDPSPKPTRQAGCHQFYLPPSYANHLRDAGFQLMNLANNHTHDMGAEGLRNTREALDAVGIKHTGAPDQITYVEVNGIKIAVIGFAIYSWSQNLNDIPAAKRLVAEAARDADLVVIQMQGGAEGSDKAHVRPGTETFYGENRGDLIKFTHAVIDAGADVVFGHGPHIMRGMEFYKGRLIAYSLGNFCGYGVLSSSGYLGVGGVLKVTLDKDGTWISGELVPTEMVKGGMVAVDADKRALSFVNRLSREDFGPSAATISAKDGAITPPSAD